jgi:prefoldin subunit 5
MTDEKKILFLTDILEQKVRKEQELQYYQEQLEELQRKMYWVKKEIDLTNTIISIIEDEKVLDIREIVQNKLEHDDNV